MSRYQRALRERIRPSLFLVLVILCVTSCATNPVTGKRQLMLMSSSQEAQLGAASDQQIVAQYGTLEDAALVGFVESVGRRMIPVSHVPEQEFNFRLLDDPVVNAFALPGGYVYLTRGILAYLNDEAGMAGVLGHEMGHVAARHSARRYTQQQLYGLGLGLGSVLSETVAKYANLAGTALSLLMLKYSRDDERESDRIGVEYATKLGYDTREMALFFRTLDQLSGGGGLPFWASTHPDPGERYETVLALTADWQARVPQTSFRSDRNGYVQRLQGLIFGQNPRQGYVKDGSFLHPDLEFRFPVPAGWRVQNSASQVAMAPQDGQAVVLFSLDSKHATPAEAASAFATTDGIQVVSSQTLNIGGLPAAQIVASAQSEQGTLGVLATFIGYGGKVYVFHGLCMAENFNTWRPTLAAVPGGFRRLTDAAALNIQPVTVQVVRASRTASFRELVAPYPIPEMAQMDVTGLATLNGMQVETVVPAGTLLKVLGGGSSPTP